ncbi:hypothetical protein ACFE04_011290 [Oxalis oulophora]
MAELWRRGCKRRRPVVEKRISNMAELWSRGWKRRRPKLVEERALYRITQILVCYNYGYGYNSESDDDDETNKWRMSRDKASDYDSVISEDPDVESTESRVAQWVNHDVAEASRALKGKLKVADTNKDDPFYQSKHPAFFLLDDRFTDFPIFERVLDPSVPEKFHRLFTTNLGKCTLFLVLELTSSSGDLVREFCSAFLSGYAKSSMRDQIYKFSCRLCSSLFSLEDSRDPLIIDLLSQRLQWVSAQDDCEVCKHFLDAVEKKQYGWFWVCPNGGKTCHYRYALPKCYILKSQMKALLEEEGEKMAIDEEIENQVRST